MSIDRHGTAAITWETGEVTRGDLAGPGFSDSSAIARSTHLLALNLLHLETVHGDHIAVQLPTPYRLAPVGGRPTIYLDQNHWSTLTNTIYAPNRVRDRAELAAATSLIDAAIAQQVILPMSSAHMSETCQQVEPEERYRRRSPSPSSLRDGSSVIHLPFARSNSARRWRSGTGEPAYCRPRSSHSSPTPPTPEQTTSPLSPTTCPRRLAGRYTRFAVLAETST